MEVIIITIALILLVGIIFASMLEKDKKDRKERIEKKIRLIPDFEADDLCICLETGAGIAINQKNKQLLLVDESRSSIVTAANILGSKVIQDNVQLVHSNRGSQAAGAIVGGVLSGGVGALVGGLSGSTRTASRVKKIVLRISTDDFEIPNHDITLFDCSSYQKKGVSPENRSYRQALEMAERWHGRVTALMRHGHIVEASGASESSTSEEIQRLANLHDEGILNDEEFSLAKAKLLGI